MFSYKDFYEDLALWGVLTIGKNQKVELRPTIWQRFLDDLCHLCDTEPGGKTVVSVAVSEEDGIQYFWVSANNNPAKAGRHLKRILNILTRISSNPDRTTERIKGQLLDFVVRKSAKRVRNYMRQLQLHIIEVDALQHDHKGEFKSYITSFGGADFRSRNLFRVLSRVAGSRQLPQTVHSRIQSQVHRSVLPAEGTYSKRA
jgi:hypothetical protein